MAAYLTQAWLDEQLAAAAELPPAVERGAPGGAASSGTVLHVVAGAPDGEVRYLARLEDGVLVENRLGSVEEPEVTLAIPYAEGLAMATGELDPGAAYMQGRIKTTGATGPLLALLAVLRDLNDRAAGLATP